MEGGSRAIFIWYFSKRHGLIYGSVFMLYFFFMEKEIDAVKYVYVENSLRLRYRKRNTVCYYTRDGVFLSVWLLITIITDPISRNSLRINYGVSVISRVEKQKQYYQLNYETTPCARTNGRYSNLHKTSVNYRVAVLFTRIVMMIKTFSH